MKDERLVEVVLPVCLVTQGLDNGAIVAQSSYVPDLVWLLKERKAARICRKLHVRVIILGCLISKQVSSNSYFLICNQQSMVFEKCIVVINEDANDNGKRL